MIAITADMSFKTALAADFKREYKNIEFLWKQRPGIGDVAALPPVSSQIPGKNLCFLVMRATEKRHVDTENLMRDQIDKIERLPRGKGSEGAFASSVRSEQRTTASTVAVRTDTRNLL